MSTEKKAASSLVTAHLRSALVILALSIHSLFEGMAVGKLHYNVVVAVVLLLLVLFLIMPSSFWLYLFTVSLRAGLLVCYIIMLLSLFF